MKTQTFPARTTGTTTHIIILALASLLGVAATAAFACGIPPNSADHSNPKIRMIEATPPSALFPVFEFVPAPAPKAAPAPPPTPKLTSDWYKNEECRMVFFTVLEGLYRDGISEEVIDLVIGRVEENNLERAFIFRCKLCHACYEAFAAYQRRPDFSGTGGVNKIGEREIPKKIIETLRTGDRRQFDAAFSIIVQPWIKTKLEEMIDSGADGTELMEKYIELANEGNALIVGYASCQACDAIAAVAKKMDEK